MALDLLDQAKVLFFFCHEISFRCWPNSNKEEESFLAKQSIQAIAYSNDRLSAVATTTSTANNNSRVESAISI